MDDSREEVTIQRTIAWTAHSDVGRFRSSNEDAFIALKVTGEGVYRLGKWGHDSNLEGDYVFAVSDGMGGAKAGDFASQIVVEQIALLFPKVFKSYAEGLTIYFQDVLSELLTNIHQAMTELGASYSELNGMGATLSLCWIHFDKVYWAHVGDSRIYHLGATETMSQLTKDDTHVAWMLEKGAISPYEARNHPKRNLLQQVIGGKTQNLNPQFGEFILNKSDRFLICSDGLTNGLFDSAIAKNLAQGDAFSIEREERMAKALVEQSVTEDGKDNTTALCFQVSEDC